MIVETELLVDEFLSELTGVRDSDECRIILHDGQTQLRYPHRADDAVIKWGLTGNNEAKARKCTTARAKYHVSYLCTRTRRRQAATLQRCWHSHKAVPSGRDMRSLFNCAHLSSLPCDILVWLIAICAANRYSPHLVCQIMQNASFAFEFSIPKSHFVTLPFELDQCFCPLWYDWIRARGN